MWSQAEGSSSTVWSEDGLGRKRNNEKAYVDSLCFWFDDWHDAIEDDVNIKVLSKIGSALTTWDVAADVTGLNIAKWRSDYASGLNWNISANGKGERIGMWLDYVRWVDAAVADGEALLPTPEPTMMSLLALGGLALLRRRK